MKSAKILIIDDDPDMFEAMRVMLEVKGCTLTPASDSSEGLARLRELKPDLLILDAMLMGNDKSGLELAAEIRRDPAIAHTPILMITAINDAGSGGEFSPGTNDERLPIDGFINKPARPEELYRTIDALLAMKVSKWAKKFSA